MLHQQKNNAISTTDGEISTTDGEIGLFLSSGSLDPTMMAI